MPNHLIKGGIHPELTYADSVLAAAAGAYLELLLTDWPDYAAIDPAGLGTVTAARRIGDGRYTLDLAAWRAAGWHYRASGIPDPARSRQPA